jgi:cyclase
MSLIRIIARLDVKGANLIKGINLEGLRVLGLPNNYAREYYLDGIDELIYMDSVASLYGRNHLASIIESTAQDVFIPITVGGGIRSIQDVKDILRAGADKIALNSASIANPNLITEIALKFGSQCVVSSIEARKISTGRWEALYDNGREKSGLDVVEWAQLCVTKGAGEILLTSVDKEGTRRGFDVELVKAVTSAVNVPVIASGGMGSPEDLVEVVKVGGADAVAAADILHYKRYDVPTIRRVALSAGIKVREFIYE